MSLESYGWDAGWAEKLAQTPLENRFPGRVIAAHRNKYQVHTGEVEISARTAGKLHKRSSQRTDLPAVGDWVILSQTDPDSEAIIQQVLPRRSTFSRKSAGKHRIEQVMATNVDTVWIVSTFGSDFNLSRLERYVTMVQESGALPVIVLAKADKVEETESTMTSLRERIPEIAIHATSAKSRTGLDALLEYLTPGNTVAVLGSSGVGKSTLINYFAGNELLVTASVREKDGKGRHTTTHRELILLPQGGLLLDTPGMRELQLWGQDDSLENSFTDIEELAQDCKFSDCKHELEPGCAVIAAVEAGALPEDRFNNFKKLRDELTNLTRRTDNRGEPLRRELKKALANDRKPKQKGRR